MPLATAELYASMGLRPNEYALILELLGREPTRTELGMFAVMWSEHCGYKYSRPILSAFARYKASLEGDGFENAGVVELGDGLGVTFKVESHNHPSAVEPYEGAATGVGGIIRDILTMGARPIACLDSLRFGLLDDPDEAIAARNRYLFAHVVAGIGGYGNCVGVPTVGGEVAFAPEYAGNPLVNAMCLGVLRLDRVTTAAASGEGNPVLYLGSATGKDGIHGATFASEELDDGSEAKRPNVQIGDPFAEKLLIEATLEALETGAIVAIQDMGAAGLTCSTVEMASKGGVGMEIDLDRAPMRESDMTAYELMLSESQERMLAVAVKGREDEVLTIFRRWGLPAEVIGVVRAGGPLVVRRHGKVEAELDPRHLTDRCPTYLGEVAEHPAEARARRFELASVPSCEPREALLRLLAFPDVASKRWAYRQYDSQVQTQTKFGPGVSGAAVLAPRGTRRGIAIALDGGGRAALLDPYAGGARAVVESVLNVACAGARPRALTDGLNFGNPERPEVYGQLKACVQGIADAAEKLGTPVISGNVSLYNRSDLGEIPPSPIIGAVGILEDASRALPSSPASTEGLGIVLLSAAVEDPLGGLGGSAYLASLGIVDGRPAAVDLDRASRLVRLLGDLAERGEIASAHDVSDGGLAVALAELALGARRGLRARLPDGPSAEARLFGETPGRVVATAKAPGQVIEAARSAGLDAVVLGAFDASNLLVISLDDADVATPLSDLAGAYEGALPRLMGEALDASRIAGADLTHVETS